MQRPCVLNLKPRDTEIAEEYKVPLSFSGLYVFRTSGLIKSESLISRPIPEKTLHACQRLICQI